MLSYVPLLTFFNGDSSFVTGESEGLVEKKVAIEETTSFATTEDMPLDSVGVAQNNIEPHPVEMATRTPIKLYYDVLSPYSWIAFEVCNN